MFSPYASFEAAAKEILQHLHHHFGFDLWTVSRTDGEEAVIVQTVDQRYGLKPGHVFKWSDSICKRMVEGLGPNIAVTLDDAPAYRSAPLAEYFSVEAYIGFPLWDCDGQLFGTLCGVDSKPQSKKVEQYRDTFVLFGRLLSTLLSMDLQLSARRDKPLGFDIDKLVDSETGLLSCTAWNRFIAAQERRSNTLGLDCYIAKVKPTEPSSRAIQQVAKFLREALGASVVLAKSKSHAVMLCIPDCDPWAGQQKLASLIEPLSTLVGKPCSFESISNVQASHCC